MGDVSEKFLSPLLPFFSLPNSAQADRQGFLAAYVEELEGFSDYQLQNAAKHLRQTRTTRTLPTIAECLEACDRFPAEPRPERRQQERGVPEEWTEERQREANRLICGELGQKATDEGWLIALWDFCRKNGRLPNKFEAKKFADYSRGTWKYVEEAERTMMERGQDISPIVQWRQTMQKRFRWLRTKVYGNTEAA